MPDGEVFITHYNAMEQWQAIIEHTEFASAIFDASGEVIGHYDGYNNVGNTDWNGLKMHAGKLVTPFLEVPVEPTYVTLPYSVLENLEIV